MPGAEPFSNLISPVRLRASRIEIQAAIEQCNCLVASIECRHDAADVSCRSGGASQADHKRSAGIPFGSQRVLNASLVGPTADYKIDPEYTRTSGVSACPLCGGRGRRLWWPWRRHGQLAVILRIWCYSFGGIVGGAARNSAFSLALSCSSAARTRVIA